MDLIEQTYAPVTVTVGTVVPNPSIVTGGRVFWIVVVGMLFTLVKAFLVVQASLVTVFEDIRVVKVARTDGRATRHHKPEKCILDNELSKTFAEIRWREGNIIYFFGSVSQRG